MAPLSPLLWINGFPGTGKFTIAKKIVELSPDDNVLIDNHQLIDPVESKISRDNPHYQEQRRLQRSIVFRDCVENPAVCSTIIFTDFQSNNELGRSVALEYQTAAQRGNRLFIPIYLSCDVEENLRRVTDPERARTQTTKLLDRSVVYNLRLNNELFRFDTPQDLSLDVSCLTATEAAELILSHVRSRLQGSEICGDEGSDGSGAVRDARTEIRSQEGRA